jgi:hypothetical protein
MLMQAITLAALLAAGAGLAATMQDGAKPPVAPGGATPAAAVAADALAPVAFLSGRWVEVNAKGNREEHWSSPRGGTMMGMFRWDKADRTPNILEILSISAEGADCVLRLHHFSAKLEVHGEGDKPMTFKLSEKGERKAVFTPTANAEMLSRIVYHCPEPDRLKISVVMATEAGEPPESLEFDMTREKK